MTKEDLLKPILEMVKFGGDYQEAENMFNEFFSQNICIPKGKNRHRDSEALHRWIEGEILQGSFDGKDWHIKAPISTLKYPYRIKPSEPIYEWQYTTMSCGIRLFTQLMTDKEFQDSSLQYDYWEKDEETKRIRQ